MGQSHCRPKLSGSRAAMKRREFIALISGAAIAWPLGARPQQPARSALPQIGLLSGFGRGPALNAIIGSLAERGFVDGKTARIVQRDANGRLERLPELARELVAVPVDVIVAVAASATVAAHQATTTIPIVMVHAGDPIGFGLIESLARPGGNVTGTSSYSPETVAKGIELLRELVPSIRRLAVLVVPSNAGTPVAVRQAQVAAANLGMDLIIVEVERSDDLEAALASIEQASADSVYVFVEPMLFANRSRLLEFAARTRLPAMYQNGDVVRDGGLIGYSPLFAAHYPRAADYVDKILNGAKPSELPVEQSTRFELVINLKTARALGLTVAPSLLARADEVIE
jgi:putative tryptophan/tyrosine transport system substrate-binding protein